MDARPRTMAVHPDLVREFLVDRIHDEVLARDPAAADDVHRHGYLSRVVEVELFPAARAPLPWLGERLRAEPAQDVARGLAAAEPAGPPRSDDDLASWRVPGPGGHVRHLVARAAGGGRVPRDELKRAWLEGFFARCCEEAAPPDS